MFVGKFKFVCCPDPSASLRSAPPLSGEASRLFRLQLVCDKPELQKSSKTQINLRIPLLSPLKGEVAFRHVSDEMTEGSAVEEPSCRFLMYWHKRLLQIKKE